LVGYTAGERGGDVAESETAGRRRVLVGVVRGTVGENHDDKSCEIRISGSVNFLTIIEIQIHGGKRKMEESDSEYSPP